jgi:lysozyme
MKINENGLDLLERCEGLRLTTYRDSVGVLTIGYGHTGPDVKLGQFITQAGAEKLLANDLEDAGEAVQKLTHVPLTSNQFSALVCFVFNVGATNFSRSTLLRFLNQGQYKKAAEEFLRWDHDHNGNQLPGLTARRAAERALFLSALP